MGTKEKEALRVVETVKLAGRIYEDAGNYVWYVPTQHPIFSALAMVAGPVSRQIEAGLLDTGVENSRRYAEISESGLNFLNSHGGDSAVRTIDVWLAALLSDAD